MDKEYNLDDMIKSFDKVKQDIIDSKILLLPNSIVKDEETLDRLFEYAKANIGKNYEDYNELDKKVTNVIASITLKAHTMLMDQNPEILDGLYKTVMEIEPESFEGTNILEVFSDHLKKNLIKHEEYEKVIEVDNKLKNRG